MTNIQLTKPAANQTQTVTSASDARFVLDFNTGDAQLAKSENGENLIITFEDGAKIEVEGFYTAFNKDNLPTLSVDGQDITGDQLTAILGEDLMPAAGPASAGPASAGGSNATFGDPALDGGINRLDGLDIGFDGAAAQQTPLEGAAVYPGQTGTVVADAPEVTAPEVTTVAAAATHTPSAPTVTPAAPGGGELVPEDTRPDYVLEHDVHNAGVMNSASHTLLTNDNKGKYAGFTVTDLTVEKNNFGDMIKVSGDKSVVSLELDADAVESAIFGGGTPHSLTGYHNTAAKAAVPGGEYKAVYTAVDESGNYVDKTDVTFKIGDNEGTLTGDDKQDVAWVAGNKGSIDAGDGNDLIVVANNQGTISAGDGADKIYLGSTEAGSSATGGAGNDMINVAGTNQGTISAGGGNDTITVNENAGTIEGSINKGDTAYIDVLEGVDKNSIKGGEGSDYVTLRGGSSEINTGGGDDKVNLRGDDMDHKWSDFRQGNDASLTIDKSLEDLDAHNAVVYGGAGRDTLQTSDATHHNTLNGGVGNDEVEAFDWSHHNTLHGDEGNDLMKARRWAHNNELFGDDGADTMYVQEFAYENTLYGGMGDDQLTARGLSPSSKTGDSETGSSLRGNAHDNVLKGGEGNDSLYATSGAQNNLLEGGEGDDYLVANGYRELASPYTTTGNTLDGGIDNDMLEVYNAATNNELYGGDGADTLHAYGEGTDGNLLDGGNGADVMSVYGGATNNTLYGGDDAATDYLYVRGSGTTGNELYGGAGNDVLKAHGGATGNLLDGGDGDDMLQVWGRHAGTTGNTLEGGAGNDLFVLNSNVTASQGEDSNTFILANNSFDGGEGIDVLLAPDVKMDTILNGIHSGDIDIQNIEAIVTKGSVGSAQELITKAGLQANNDGGVDVTASGWTAGSVKTFNDPSDNQVTFQEYTSDDGMAILVAQSIVAGGDA